MANRLRMTWYIKVAIGIAILWGFSEITGTQLAQVVEAAFGLFVILAGLATVMEWFYGIREGRGLMDDGEPGSGMEDGE